jgi:hypothetical protein
MVTKALPSTSRSDCGVILERRSPAAIACAAPAISRSVTIMRTKARLRMPTSSERASSVSLTFKSPVAKASAAAVRSLNGREILRVIMRPTIDNNTSAPSVPPTMVTNVILVLAAASVERIANSRFSSSRMAVIVRRTSSMRSLPLSVMISCRAASNP